MRTGVSCQQGAKHCVNRQTCKCHASTQTRLSANGATCMAFATHAGQDLLAASGCPTAYPLTQNDQNGWSQLAARDCLWCMFVGYQPLRHSVSGCQF